MQRGLTKLEGIVAIAVVLIFAALVIVSLPQTPYGLPTRVECLNNVRNLVGLLEMAAYPDRGGADLILYLVTKGDLFGEDRLELLFCPGDRKESLAQAGGTARYKKLELGQPNGDLTSYAGRDLLDPRFALPRKDPSRSEWSRAAVVLIADDSEDHHDGTGIVVGLTGGAAKWRDKLDFYGMEGDLVVGPGSGIEELRCLKVD